MFHSWMFSFFRKWFHDPHLMSYRARGYLTVVGLRHFSTGMICLLAPDYFIGHSFDVIRHWAPLAAWGVLMIFLGFLGLSAAVIAQERSARFVIIFSLTITSFWAGSFIVDSALYAGPATPAPIWAVAWLALAAKDLILSAMPMRSPFEDLELDMKPRETTLTRG